MINRLVYFNYTLQKCEIIPVKLPIVGQRNNVCLPGCHNKVCILNSANVELIKICLRLTVQAWNYWIFVTRHLELFQSCLWQPKQEMIFS